MATHLNIWHNSTQFGKVHFEAMDTIMVATPIFHCWGLIIRQVEDRLRWRYAEAWGLTEVSCVGTTSPYTKTRIGSCCRGMDDAEIREYCKKRMAPYKVPVHVEFVHEVPRSASGKALMRLLLDK